MKTSFLLFTCYFLLISCQKERNDTPLYEPSLTQQVNFNSSEIKTFHRTEEDRVFSTRKPSLQESERLWPTFGKPSQWR